MENATKALLIAAAVLVAILIISLGLVIYNMASETVENAGDLSEYEIQQHNEKFKKYVGDNQTGSNVNAMLTTVFNHNLVQADEHSMIEVSVGDTTVLDSTTLDEPANKVSTGTRYTVEAEYVDGMIKSISVDAKD